MDIILKYKECKRQEKINNYELETLPEDLTPVKYHIQYKDRHQYTFMPKYRFKYHFAEVFNRVTCFEQNKPGLEEINLIKSKLGNDYSQDSIYRNTNYNQRKHLIYIWQILNNIPGLNFNQDLIRKHDVILSNFNVYYRTIGFKKRAIKYRLVMDVICERMNYTDIRERLYFKDNLTHREIVNQALDDYKESN